MLETFVDLWKHHDAGAWVVITTNGFVKKSGQAVMGRGCALEAATKYPDLPLLLGTRLQESGNKVYTFPQYRIITFPVKHAWYEKADLNLIESSLQQLVKITERWKSPIYCPRFGCGNGQLDWLVVKVLAENYLDNRFTICHKER